MKLIAISGRILILLTLISLAGCHGKPSVVGRWKVDPQFLKENAAGLPPGFGDYLSQQFKLHFMVDNRFTLGQEEGSYKMEGVMINATLTLAGGAKVTNGGYNLTPDLTGSISNDGSFMILTFWKLQSSQLPPGMQHGIRFVRDDG